MSEPKHPWPVSLRRTNITQTPHVWYDIETKKWSCHSTHARASGTTQRAAYKKWRRTMDVLEPKSRKNTAWFSPP